MKFESAHVRGGSPRSRHINSVSNTYLSLMCEPPARAVFYGLHFVKQGIIYLLKAQY